MIILLGILFGFIGLCIVGLVLLQEGKGGGIAAMGVPGMDSVMGARNPLRRLTVVFSVVFLALILGINVHIHRQRQSEVPDAAPLKVEEAEAPAETPVGGAPDAHDHDAHDHDAPERAPAAPDASERPAGDDDADSSAGDDGAQATDPEATDNGGPAPGTDNAEDGNEAAEAAPDDDDAAAPPPPDDADAD